MNTEYERLNMKGWMNIESERKNEYLILWMNTEYERMNK